MTERVVSSGLELLPCWACMTRRTGRTRAVPALNKTADDICAVTDWHYMTLKSVAGQVTKRRRSCWTKLPRTCLCPDEVANLPSALRVYKRGCDAPETLFTKRGRRCGLDVITQGFGVANYYRMNGQGRKGRRNAPKEGRVHGGTQKWYAAFGCLAARVDHRRTRSGPKGGARTMNQAYESGELCALRCAGDGGYSGGERGCAANPESGDA